MKKSERVTKEKIMINILEYGAVGDGQTNDAPVIQKAIDTCAEQGGGVVPVSYTHLTLPTILLV